MEHPSVQCASLDTTLRSKRSAALPPAPLSPSLSPSLSLSISLSLISTSISISTETARHEKERKKKKKTGTLIRVRDSDRCSPFPARRLRRRHAAPRSSRCKSSSPPGQSGRLLLPLPPHPPPVWTAVYSLDPGWTIGELWTSVRRTPRLRDLRPPRRPRKPRLSQSCGRQWRGRPCIFLLLFYSCNVSGNQKYTCKGSAGSLSSRTDPVIYDGFIGWIKINTQPISLTLWGLGSYF